MGINGAIMSGIIIAMATITPGVNPKGEQEEGERREREAEKCPSTDLQQFIPTGAEARRPHGGFHCPRLL